MTPDYYYYLSQSDTYKVDGTDDRSDFSETVVSTHGHSSPGTSDVTSQETETRRWVGTCSRAHSEQVKEVKRGSRGPDGVRAVTQGTGWRSGLVAQALCS